MRNEQAVTKALTRGLVLAGFAILLLSARPASAQDGTVVQNSNSSRRAAAVSGPAVGANAVGANAGPSARSILGTSQAQQTGNNTVVVSQENTTKSGDAVAGSQVTGVVSDGDVTVQNQNSSRGSVAVSGPAVGVNAAAVNAGPSASSIVGGAQAQQTGNNSAVVAQTNNTESGDAIAGSQVTGVVGDGDATVQNSNSSRGALALSGPAFGINAANVTSGPAASTFLGRASVGQVGNNDAVLSQAMRTASGDALAGSQSTGVVAGGLNNFIGGQNAAVASFAATGRSAGRNLASGGPGPATTAFLGTSNASQFGNNSGDAAQAFVNESGDALSGSQTSGLVSQEQGALSEQANTTGL